MIAHSAAPAQVSREFEAELCWLDSQPLNPARKYAPSGTRLTSAKVRAVLSHRDIHELQEVENTEGVLRMNDIGRCRSRRAMRSPSIATRTCRRPARSS